MPGCASLASVCRSARKRRSVSGEKRPGRTIFTATFASYSESARRARKTAPMPPEPSSSRIS